MIRTFQITLVLIYLLLVEFSFLILLALSGVAVPDRAAILITVGWLFLCFSSGYWLAPYFYFRHSSLRKPVFEEEERLKVCFEKVQERSNCKRNFRLLVEESMELNASAIGRHTIAVTRGMLEQMTDEELKGLLAHELGHHLNKDTLVMAAFGTASVLSGSLRRFLTAILIRLFAADKLRLIIALFLLVMVLPVQFLTITGACLAFVLLFALADPLFRQACLCSSRFIEYKQDAYAHQLGFGQELKEALRKLTLEGPQEVNTYFILTKSSHPVIYNRIRRLERLEGLRS